MKNNIVRPIPLTVTIVAVVGIAALLINAHRHPVAAPVAATADQNQSLCYILNKPTASGHNDIAYLKLTSSDGGAHTTGELGIALAEKDSMHGTLTGTVTASADNATAVFDGQYVNSGEGMNNVNEQMIKLDNDQAMIGYGAPGAVTYSLAIPSADCAQYDQLKTASN